MTPDPTIREFSPLKAVAVERIKQNAKWGEQNHGDLEWLAILGEEFGEVAECVCKTAVGPKDDAYYDLLEYELLQVAAVAVAWVECYRRREKDTT